MLHDDKIVVRMLFPHSWLLLVPIPFHNSQYSHSWYGIGTVDDISITTLCVLC